MKLLRYCKYRFSFISVIKLFMILFLAVIVGLYYARLYNRSSANVSSSVELLDYYLFIMNDKFFICYTLCAFALLSLTTVYSSSQSKHDELIINKLGNRNLWNVYNIISIYIISLVIICAISIVILLVGILSGIPITAHHLLRQEYKTLFNISLEGLCALSFSFMFLRMALLGFLCYITNIIVKKAKIGFVVIILVSVFDLFFYEVINIERPLYFTLLEHSRVFYTSALDPINNQARPSFVFSYLYWLALHYTLYCFSDTIVKRKDFLLNQAEGDT